LDKYSALRQLTTQLDLFVFGFGPNEMNVTSGKNYVAPKSLL